ncbi:XkdX family protein [Lysinibacillus sp. JNUCC-52]|nr:XkdX family protein [Lysinibacillus sp. JNUCC-52]
MDWLKMINGFYPKYWTKEMVGDAVEAGKITAEQYKEITGDKYSPTKMQA